MCGCIPQVLQLISSGALSRVLADADVSAATRGLLEVFAQLQRVGFWILNM